MRSTWASQSDDELLSEYRKSLDKAVVGELFKRHSLMCFSVCMKYLKQEDAAQDATMQIFEKLFSDLARLQVLQFRNWLHSVARNHCLMLLRKPALLQSLAVEDENSEDFFMQSGMLLHQANGEEELEQKLQALEQALQELNQKQGECIKLFYLEQLSYEEVSDKTGYSLNEVKSHLQNGKRNVKLSLARKGIKYSSIVLMLWIQQHV